MKNNLAAPRILHEAFVAKPRAKSEQTIRYFRHNLVTKLSGDFITSCNSKMERITQKVEE